MATYEENMRTANKELLRAGNFTEVPSTDVLKTAGQECSNRYRLDEDMFKELRIFRHLTRRLDQYSKDVKGKENQSVSMYRKRTNEKKISAV